MRVVLTAVDDLLFHAWKEFCEKFPFVTLHHGSIFDNPVDALVSPANSFGFMDGGIDYTYSMRFGWELEAALQDKIQREFNGELLVGQATMIATPGDPQFPLLIAAPTMRVPMRLPDTTINPYLAARAALRCAKEEGIRSIAFPGLGTGVGDVDPRLCAKQVAEAIEEVIEGNYIFPYSWDDALHRHKELYLI